MKSRAMRRHHRDRMKRKARRIFHGYWGWTEANERHIGMYADNLAFCACEACQGKRKPEEQKWRED